MKRPDTRATRQMTAQKMQEGIRKHFAKTKTIAFGGASYTPAALEGLFQEVLDKAKATDEAKAGFHAAVEAEQKARATLQPVQLALTSYVYLNHGGTADVLGDFGLSPRKKKQPTVKTKAAALDKAAETRKANAPGGGASQAVSPPKQPESPAAANEGGGAGAVGAAGAAGKGGSATN